MAVRSAVLFVLLMLGAIHTHVFRAHQSIKMVIPAWISLILSIMVINLERISTMEPNSVEVNKINDH